MSQKWPQKWLEMAHNVHSLCQIATKLRTGHVLGSNQKSDGTLSTCKPPLFVVSKPENCPTRRLHPRTNGHLVKLGGSPGRARGANGGSTRVPGAKKIILFKVVPKQLGMLKQLFSACFEPVVTHFGPYEIQKNALKMGRFGTNNASKMGQKHNSPKVILYYLVCLNRCF